MRLTSSFPNKAARCGIFLALGCFLAFGSLAQKPSPVTNSNISQNLIEEIKSRFPELSEQEIREALKRQQLVTGEQVTLENLPESVALFEEDDLLEEPTAEDELEPELTDSEEVVKSPEEVLEEDPFAEEGEDRLGLEEGPLAEEGEDGLGLEEDPFAEDSESGAVIIEEDGTGLGLEDDPFAEDGEGAIVADEKGLVVESVEVLVGSLEELAGDNETEVEEVEPFLTEVDFTHSITTQAGFSEIKGLYLIDPSLNKFQELRLNTKYEQSVRIRTSPNLYNYFRLAVSFTQHYEINQQRFYDLLLTVREIWSNYRTGSHQLRYGTQLFSLGKVDIDRTIDVLHLGSLMAFYLGDPEATKTALPALKYNYFRGPHTFTAYAVPIRQQTVGMEFTEFREGIEQEESGKKSEGGSILRDYLGLQYQWSGDILDARVGFFHWFDSDTAVSFNYERSDNASINAKRKAFENLLGNYVERESRTNFLTLELDATWQNYVWKLDLGLFDQKNAYSYEAPTSNKLNFSTIRAPYRAWATSLETSTAYGYGIVVLSQRHFSNVPANSHLILYENESSLVNRARNVERWQLTGIGVLEPTDDLRVALVGYTTWPFSQRALIAQLTWDRVKANNQWSMRLVRLDTDTQKMLGSPVSSTQVFVVYTEKFKTD